MGTCQLCSPWQLSAEGSHETSQRNHTAQCGTTGGTWLGPRRHCHPIRPNDQPQLVSQTEPGYFASYPGAPWETSASREPHPMFGNQSVHQKDNPGPGILWFNFLWLWAMHLRDAGSGPPRARNKIYKWMQEPDCLLGPLLLRCVISCRTGTQLPPRRM